MVFQASGQGNGFGDLTAWNPNPNNTVFALDRIDTTVFLGGSFTNLIPKPATPLLQYNRNRLAAVGSSGIGIPTSWNPNLDDSVLSLTHVGTTVYAGGAFTTVNGNVARGGGAAFSASGAGAATDWNPEVLLGAGQTGAVYSLVASGSTMYRSGIFRSVGGPWTGSPSACNAPVLPEPDGRGRLTDARRAERQLGAGCRRPRAVARARAAGARHGRSLHGDRLPADRLAPQRRRARRCLPGRLRARPLRCPTHPRT